MEDQPPEYRSREFIKQTYKGGSIIQKMLKVNDDVNNAFSIDEYHIAIGIERTKRQQQLRENNAELKRRRELRLTQGIIDPELAEKKSQLKQDIHNRLTQSAKYMSDIEEKLKERVMAERMKQSIATKIRKRNKQVFEFRENMKNGTGSMSNIENWNVNAINIETDENANRIKRIIISKRRGRMTDEVTNLTL